MYRTMLYCFGRRRNRRQATLERMHQGWNDLIDCHPSTDQVLKSQWRERGLQLMDRTSPAMPTEILTTGGAEDSSDDMIQDRHGFKFKHLEFKLPFWLSSTATKIITAAYDNRKGRDKENRMDIVEVPEPQRGFQGELPADQRYQWMIGEAYKAVYEEDNIDANAIDVVNAVIEPRLPQLPDMFVRPSKHNMSGMRSRDQQPAIVVL